MAFPCEKARTTDQIALIFNGGCRTENFHYFLILLTEAFESFIQHFLTEMLLKNSAVLPSSACLKHI